MMGSRQPSAVSRQDSGAGCSIAAQLQAARQVLKPIAGDSAALEARVLAGHAWGMSAEALVQHADDARDDAALQQLLRRRLQHEPVAQILGMKHFWRDAFYVSREVLTPRADSETMLECLLRLRPQQNAALRVLDLGTGSGCLLLSALREYPHAHGVGVDQSEAALSIAAHNAENLQLSTRSVFLRSNWCSNVAGEFDIVLANPPYIPASDIAALDADVRAYEPHAALDGGVDGLGCYRSIVAQIGPHLAPNALLLFEVGMGRAADVAALGQAHGLTLVDITADLAGIPRVVCFTQTT
jgi:release factor glutamine methyltransferase